MDVTVPANAYAMVRRCHQEECVYIAAQYELVAGPFEEICGGGLHFPLDPHALLLPLCSRFGFAIFEFWALR